MEKEIELIFNAVLKGDVDTVQQQTQAAIEAGMDPDKILNQGLIASMKEVGHLYETREFFVPEMLIAARAMQSGLNLLRPFLLESGVQPAGKIIIGTVQGDLHDIGKNLVSMMMEGAGFEVDDLGTDVSPDTFVESVKAGADILALSSLLTTTMPSMESTIKAMEDAGIRDQVKIIIGGAPVTQEYADLIGADGFAADASRAASVAKDLVA